MNATTQSQLPRRNSGVPVQPHPAFYCDHQQELIIHRLCGALKRCFKVMPLETA